MYSIFDIRIFDRISILLDCLTGLMFNAKVHHVSMTDFDQLAPRVDSIQNTGDGGRSQRMA